jgi:hypothetical protein
MSFCSPPNLQGLKNLDGSIKSPEKKAKRGFERCLSGFIAIYLHEAAGTIKWKQEILHLNTNQDIWRCRKYKFGPSRKGHTINTTSIPQETGFRTHSIVMHASTNPAGFFRPASQVRRRHHRPQESLSANSLNSRLPRILSVP